MNRTNLLILALVVLNVAADLVDAQTLRRRDLERLGVDLVEMKSGPRLRGAILDRKPQGEIRIAVRREWVKETHTDFHSEFEQREAAEHSQGIRQLIDRIDAWIKLRADDKPLLRFLREEKSRFETLLVEKKNWIPDSQFLVVEVPPAELRRVYVQPMHRKRIAGLAWRENIADVESTPISRLIEVLRQKGVDPNSDTADLSDRLPPRAQSEKEWAARRALVEFEFGRRVEFQGTGDAVFRTGPDGQPANQQQLLSELLASQLTAELNDLLSEPGLSMKAAKRDWKKTATDAADRDGALGVLVTRIESPGANRPVRVTAEFLAQMPDDQWQTVWSHSATADPTKPREELEERIRNDPQLRRALRLLKGLGVGEGGELDQAIRVGAATMEAQETVKSKFWEFRERATKRLDATISME